MKIRVLKDPVINKIAAGEVIERPVSVVRELVDNSVDSGATDIAVFLEQGGRSLIRVLDNGSGMGRDDALLAFERHATSKISEAEDLERVTSMGFRGEALSSIAGVAKVTLRTREGGAPSGTEVQIEGGKILAVREAVCPEGTEIEVRSLFFSVPARKKFLKQPRTEYLRIKQWLEQSALGHPEIRYRLFSDGAEVVNLPRRETLLERARELLRGSTVEFSSEREGYSVTGLVAHPGHAQFDAGSLVLLVNRRLVTDRMLLRAVRDGFSSTLKDREYPVGVVSLELPAAELDVNVHPQKSEVRFRDGQRVFSTVFNAVREAVTGFCSPAAREDFERPVSSWGGGRAAAGVQSEFELRAASAESGVRESASFEAPRLEGEFRYAALRYLGQALGCYLFCEYAGRVFVVDMHAAHERYNFNLVRNGFRQKGVPSQQLLVPVTVELSEQGTVRVVEQADELARYGFEIEQFGPAAIAVRAAPAVLSTEKVREVIRDIAALPEDAEASGGVEMRIDQISARIACHASVRSGRILEREEVYALFDALDRTEFSAACPHGRPVIVSFSAEEIERWFGRDR